MGLRWFTCPDNERIETQACLAESGCRMRNRCATRSYLQLVSKQRPLIYKCPQCGYEREENANRCI